MMTCSLLISTASGFGHVALCAFLRMLFVVTLLTEADQVRPCKGQLRMIFQMQNVVHGRRLCYPAESLADLALVFVPAKDSSSDLPPSC